MGIACEDGDGGAGRDPAPDCLHRGADLAHRQKMAALPTIAVINTSADTVDMLRHFFEHEGFVVVSTLTTQVRDASVNLDGFIAMHAPDVVLYDIALPYDVNWRLFCHLRERAIGDVPVVITTTNVRHVEPLAGSEPVHEIVGKPVDLRRLLEVVRSALQR